MMYKIELDKKYYIIVSNAIDSNNIDLYIHEKFKKYKDEIFYEISYIGGIDAAGYFCPYIPLTFINNINLSIKTIQPVEISNGLKCHINNIYYIDIEALQKVINDKNYLVKICTDNKKICATLRITL